MLVLPLILVTIVAQTVSSISCPETSHPIVRIFPTLEDYQKNRIPFDPTKETGGNYVAFAFKSIDNLPKNAFLTMDSEHVAKIDLTGKSIAKIQNGAFFSLTCLKYLTMANNSLTEISFETFEGLVNVQELNLHGNKLEAIADMTFASLRRLSYLDLSDNRLKKLSTFCLNNLTNLSHLNLSGNSLVYIQPEVFLPTIKLQTLDLSRNKMNDPESHRWPLQNLLELDLSSNFLISFDTSLNFSYGQLRNLNLRSNRLRELNVYALNRNFKELRTIDLNRNYWQCGDLVKILHILADFRVRAVPGNVTAENYSGIDCEKIVTIAFDSSLETTTTSAFTSPAAKSTDKSLKIVGEIKNLTVEHNEILVEISGVRKLLIFILLFVVIAVIFFALFSIQAGFCDSARRRFAGNRDYIDTTIQDNYTMLG